MRRPAVPFLALLLICLVSCIQTTHPFAPFDDTSGAPVNDSPENAVKRYEWAWNNRQPNALTGLLTEDFQFVFAAGDSSGNAFRSAPWGLGDELLSSQHMFVGGGSLPPAKAISLALARTLAPLPDSRPGKNPKWHKQIRTTVDLKVDVDNGRYTVSGNASFFVVRGDSALISPEVAALGFHADSTRWWIERLEDETLPSGGGGLHANPSITFTWGSIKVLYH